MPCIPVGLGIVCTGRQRRQRCKMPGCNEWAVAVCDYPIDGSTTCDLRVCARHRVKVAPGVDYCTLHPLDDVREPREARA
jgi:hypothetical protein